MEKNNFICSKIMKMAKSKLEEIPLPSDQNDSASVISKTLKKSAKEMLQEALKDHKHTTADVKLPASRSTITHEANASDSQQPCGAAIPSQSIVDELFKDFITKKFGGTLKESQTSSRLLSKSSSVDDKLSEILDMEISSIKSKTVNQEDSQTSEKPIPSHYNKHEVLPSIENKKYKLTEPVEKQRTAQSPIANKICSNQRDSASAVESDTVGTASTSSLPCLSTPTSAICGTEIQSPVSVTKSEAPESKQQVFTTMLPLPVAKKLGAPKLLKMKLSSESLSLIKSTDHVDRDGRLWEEGEVVSSHSEKSDKDDDSDSDGPPSGTGSIASSNGQPEQRSSRHKKKHKHKQKKKKKKSSKDKGRNRRSMSKDRDSNSAGRERKGSRSKKEKTHSRDASSEKEDSKRGREKAKKRRKSHSRSRSPKHRKKSRSHSGSPGKRKDSTDSDRHQYSEWDARHYSDVSRHRSRSKESSSDRRKKRSRERSRSTDRDMQIDKAKLRRIAIANALQNMKSGQGPLVDVTVVKSGGKSVEELTEFCKKISAKNKDKEDSDSDEDSEDNKMLSEDEDRLIHHPFKVREQSTNIIMNIRNAKQLPVLTPSEKQAQQATLRLTFPVSSGSHHRASESEWVPVEKPVPSAPSIQPQSTQSVKPDTPSLEPVKTESIFPDVSEGQKIDISSIISERLQAVRRLQENPYDVQALTKMHKVQEQASKWAVSKHLPGQFMGTTGAHVLSQEELIGNKKHQAWARKTQLVQAAPVNGGIGMFLLQKMGWKQGEGLGKNNEGSKEPLLLDVKIDRKGLTAAAENPKQKAQVPHAARAKDLSNKHPVSALMELCNKRRWGPPLFTVVEESGPDHKKTFLFKVKINNVEYQPATASLNKKTAKAQCAAVCLQEMGLLPRDAKINY